MSASGYPDEIQAFLSSGGRVRRFEEQATADWYQVLDWISRQGIFVKPTAAGQAIVGRKKVDLAGLYDIANDMRRSRGLEPLCIGKCHAKKRPMRF